MDRYIEFLIRLDSSKPMAHIVVRLEHITGWVFNDTVDEVIVFLHHDSNITFQDANTMKYFQPNFVLTNREQINYIRLALENS